MAVCVCLSSLYVVLALNRSFVCCRTAATTNKQKSPPLSTHSTDNADTAAHGLAIRNAHLTRRYYANHAHKLGEFIETFARANKSKTSRLGTTPPNIRRTRSAPDEPCSGLPRASAGEMQSIATVSLYDSLVTGLGVAQLDPLVAR